MLYQIRQLGILIF